MPKETVAQRIARGQAAGLSITPLPEAGPTYEFGVSPFGPPLEPPAGTEMPGVGIGAGAGVFPSWGGMDGIGSEFPTIPQPIVDQPVAFTPEGIPYATGGGFGPTVPGVVAQPAVAGVALAGLGVGKLTIGFLKTLLAKYGPTLLKMIVGAGVFTTFMKLLGLGASDETEVTTKRRKRYSIGANPRLNTLLKVAKRVDNIFTNYDRRISKFRSRIKGPQRRTYRPRPYYGFGQQYLSPVERKAITRRS